MTLETSSSKILHTLNKPPSNAELIEKLKNVFVKGDSILLIEDGTYNLLQLENLPVSSASNVYALSDDVRARGINSDQKPVKLVDYDEFVELTLSHDKVISWY